jgi:hypothetical protein
MMMSIDDRIRTGYYGAKIPYPSKPVQPVMLIKRAKDLTLDEINQLATIKAQYEADLAAWPRLRAAYSRSEAEGIRSLRRDLEADHHLVDHPRAQMLWEKAWENGHSDGLHSVAQWYDDLAELIS